MTKTKKYLSIALLMVIAGCGENKKNDQIISEEKVKEISADVKITRIEQELFLDKSKEGIQSILKKYPAFNKKYFGKFFPDDKITVQEVYAGINNKSIDTVYQICQEVYGNMEDIKSQFEETSKRIKAVYPRHHIQEINTFISGMGFWGNDLYVGDSLVVVSLDFFLAEKCKYVPNLPNYLLKRYRKEYIVPHVAAVIANKYNQTDFLDNSLVAEMIYFGKSYYFMEQVLPSVHDTIICGYTNTELTEVQSHEDIIWAHLLDKKLLFETKNEITNKYIGERPSTVEIGNKCPGRIGRWLGWQIVRKYMEKHPDYTLADLMKEKDARKIFNESKYKPEPKKKTQ